MVPAAGCSGQSHLPSDHQVHAQRPKRGVGGWGELFCLCLGALWYLKFVIGMFRMSLCLASVVSMNVCESRPIASEFRIPFWVVKAIAVLFSTGATTRE